MMAERDRRILNLFAAQVHQHFPVARLWACGSRARGDSTWESDLDVCVVLQHHDSNIDERIGEIAWEIGFEYGLVMTPICFTREAFEQGPMSESTLVSNILHDGMAA